MAKANSRRTKRVSPAVEHAAVKGPAKPKRASAEVRGPGSNAPPAVKAGGPPKRAPADERRFLELVKNHGEMRRLLTDLSMVKDMAVLGQHVASVAVCWLRLGKEHLVDARACAQAGLVRAVYSRSYYAAYNASKAVRFVVQGTVSLRGDDHRAVAGLPDKFPNVDQWTARLPEMYRHRLLADYDNWRDSDAERNLTPEQSIQYAEEFLEDCRKFLKDEYGVTP